MLNELDEALKRLLTERGGLEASEVDVAFDIPTREWAAPVTKPTINLYLYDLRENLKLRETRWTQELNARGTQGTSRRGPVRVDISYMVTCWTNAAEDQHRLLWQVLDTLWRHPMLPRDILAGTLALSSKDIHLEAAQPDGVLKNLSDFWGALGNQLRPAINLVVTLELDLGQVSTAPLVFARVLRTGRAVVTEGHAPRVVPEQPGPPLELGGLVRRGDGTPVAGAAVRLLTAHPDGSPRQVGVTVTTDGLGRYRLPTVRAGHYTLVVESPGSPPQQRPYHVEVDADRGSLGPDFVYEVALAEPARGPVP